MLRINVIGLQIYRVGAPVAMNPTLKSIFDTLCEDVIFDASLVNRLKRYKAGFINKNPSHASFFGGVLLGVDVVKHTPMDRAEFFEDVVGIDEEEAREAILTSPLVKKDFVRVSDPYNALSIYVAHRLHKERSLSPQLKHEGMHAVIYMLQAKLFTSILNHWYKRPAAVEEAKATYANLTMKVGIKQVDSWDQWFVVRVDKLLSPDSIHLNAIHNFTPDDGNRGVLYSITEPQDRLREVVKTIFDAHKEVRASGGRIRTTTSTIQLDGEILIRSNTNISKQYLSYGQMIMLDKQTFIRGEILEIVMDAVSSVSETLFLQLLTWTCESHAGRTKIPSKELVEGLVLHAISFIQENKYDLKRVDDFALTAIRLKDLYMAPRLRDEGLLKCREMAEEIVVKSKVSKSSSQQSSLRSSLMLYIVLRTIAKNFYQ